MEVKATVCSRFRNKSGEYRSLDTNYINNMTVIMGQKFGDDNDIISDELYIIIKDNRKVCRGIVLSREVDNSSEDICVDKGLRFALKVRDGDFVNIRRFKRYDWFDLPMLIGSMSRTVKINYYLMWVGVFFSSLVGSLAGSCVP